MALGEEQRGVREVWCKRVAGLGDVPPADSHALWPYCTSVGVYSTPSDLKGR